MMDAIKLMYWCLIMGIGFGFFLTVIWVCFGIIIGFYKTYFKKKKIDQDFYKGM
jgi:ABC-type dipeptide/oligopeptide/nickel transport system permease subunit